MTSSLTINTTDDVNQLLKTNQIELIPIIRSSFHSAEVWFFFSEIKILEDNSISDKVTCSDCYKLYKVYNFINGKKTNTNGTSTLKRHILTCISKTKNQIIPFLNRKTKIIIPNKHQNALNKSLLKLIICSGSSFLFCENQALPELINYTLQLSRIHNITDITDFLPKRKPLKVIMRDEINEFKRMLKIMINERFYLKKDICISLDIATESINKVPYIGIILYFIQGDNN